MMNTISHLALGFSTWLSFKEIKGKDILFRLDSVSVYKGNMACFSLAGTDNNLDLNHALLPTAPQENYGTPDYIMLRSCAILG